MGCLSYQSKATKNKNLSKITLANEKRKKGSWIQTMKVTFDWKWAISISWNESWKKKTRYQTKWSHKQFRIDFLRRHIFSKDLWQLYKEWRQQNL